MNNGDTVFPRPASCPVVRPVRSFPLALGHTVRAALRGLADPRAGADRIAEKIAGVAEQVARRGERPRYPAQPDWEERLHALVGAPWPCRTAFSFREVWERITTDLRRRGLRVSRGSYEGFDDADPGLARGLTSRVLLEAFDLVGKGRLWSIDLPPLSAPLAVRRGEIAAAVPEGRRARWRYREGSSRSRLGPLLRELGKIDLFVHDSCHSTRNVRFELERAWPVLRPGGIALCDDIDLSFGFGVFETSVDSHDALHCPSDDGRRLFGVMRKRS